jgi:hypothetical protein
LRTRPRKIKIVPDNECLQQEDNFKELGCEISYDNEEDIEQKLVKFVQILEILNNDLKPNLVKKLSRIYYIMHWLYPFFTLKRNLGP